MEALSELEAILSQTPITELFLKKKLWPVFGHVPYTAMI